MRGRSGTGKKAGYPRGGTRMAKSERGKRTRDCNLINPRLEVAQPVDRKRSRSPRNLDRPTRSLWKKGDRSPFIDLPRRSMRPYSPSVRLGWIFTRAHAPTTFSLLLGFINRDRTYTPASHRRASFEICAREEWRERRRARRVRLGPRARAGGRRSRWARPAVITMQTRMLELFDEFQTRCNADGRKHRLRVRSLYRMFHLSRCRVIGLDASVFIPPSMNY